MRASTELRVFLSYRRMDSRYATKLLFTYLQPRFPRVFMDDQRIVPGNQFTLNLRSAIEGCDVLVAVIGKDWVTGVDEHGNRRLDNPKDWLVEEVSSALTRGVPVIPVLLDGTEFPRIDELPAALAPLTDRQYICVNFETFVSDANRLAQIIEGQTPEEAFPKYTPEPSDIPVGKPVNAIAVSGDGHQCAVGIDGEFKVINLRSGGNWNMRVGTSRNKVAGVAFDPTGDILAVGSHDGTTSLWHTSTRTRHQVFTHKGPVTDVSFSERGGWLGTASEDCSAGLWNLDSSVERRLKHRDPVRSVAFTTDGARVATGSDDGRACIWDVVSGAMLLDLMHDDWVLGVAFARNGDLLGTCSGKGARVWDIKFAVPVPPQELEAPSMGPVSQTTEVGKIKAQRRPDLLHGGRVLAITFSPDGSRIATADAGHRLRIWDIGTGKALKVFQLDGKDVFQSIRFSWDGTRLIAGGSDGNLWILDAT